MLPVASLLPNRPDNARRRALGLLLERDPLTKAAGALRFHAQAPAVDPSERIEEPPGIPGRPERPPLVAHAQLKRRSPNSVAGRASLLHAIAHIELNAIDLALDAVWRFAGMPLQFYVDWIKVAREEAHHFSLLAEHLGTLGFQYGDFPAHNALWEMAQRTRGDVLARIALVPRTLEARGLDASPPIRAKLAQAGDLRAAEILDVILRDEIGHVAIGNRWFHWLCEARELDPIATFARLANEYDAPRLRGPFNLPARRAAGFSESELIALQSVDFQADQASRPFRTKQFHA